MDQYFEALEKSKNSIALNIVEQMGFDETADVLEKGRAAQMGEMRIWNNIKYQKTPNGWVPVKGEQKSEKKDEFSENAQKALDFIKDDLDFFTEVKADDDGKTIKLSTIGYKKYEQLKKKLTDAGFEFKEGIGDYYPGDDEKDSEGIFRIKGYKPKKEVKKQFNSGIDWSKAEKEYVECLPFKSNYDTGDGPEEIKSIKLYEDWKGWEVIGNEMGQIVFEGKAGQNKKFKTKEAAIKAVEDAIKKTQK